MTCIEYKPKLTECVIEVWSNKDSNICGVMDILIIMIATLIDSDTEASNELQFLFDVAYHL